MATPQERRELQRIIKDRFKILIERSKGSDSKWKAYRQIQEEEEIHFAPAYKEIEQVLKKYKASTTIPRLRFRDHDKRVAKRREELRGPTTQELIDMRDNLLIEAMGLGVGDDFKKIISKIPPIK